ncbi:HNH endonuclease [Flavobacterium chryseum]|uniref:HNH endonuclease signature motif containing protein n=1 Tax=Flavobacterium sp. P3160 TaxID=2512113 RepID=UPI00105C71FE|nr:HNH endonuclease signature motif containing protein [Flavobacterium sp. P3160]TDO68766.1 HNH endonuclease [Flavobacterium sp. P3160]
MAKFRRTPEGLTTLTPEQDLYISENYLSIPLKTMARIIGKSSCLSIRTRMKQLGLVVPADLAEKRRIDSAFKKGHIPENKGLKQIDYMTPEAIENSKKTWFQKGHLPHNTAEKDGEIRIRYSHKKRGYPPYKWIRISLGKWQMLHVFNWEKVNGKVPEGHIIIFKDKNTLNTEIRNLEMITFVENMQRNSIQNYPEDLKEIMLLKGQIKRQINKHLKDSK